MLELKRLYQTDKVTIGALLINHEPMFWTLEEPWHNNEQNNSCIPKGHYRAISYDSSKFGQTYKVTDLAGREVPNRVGILIHNGNTTQDTSGCILIGLELGYIQGEKAVLRSKEAFRQFISKMYGIESCEFIIT